MIKFEFKYAKEDIQNAFDLHYAKQFPIRSKLVLILALVLFFIGVLLFIFQISSFPQMKWLFLLMGLFYIGFYFYRKKKMVDLAFSNPNISGMSGMEIGTKTIKFIGDKGEFVKDWTSFNDWAQDEKNTLIYLSKHNFFIIPTRCLNGESKIELDKILKSALNA